MCIKSMAKITISKTQIKQLTNNSVSFHIPAFIARYLQDVVGDDLTVKVAPLEKTRTINQNAKLWALIGDIDQSMNGRRSKSGEEAIYMNLIEMANIKTIILGVHVEALNDLQKRGTFRVVQVIDMEEQTAVCKCYFGSSQFTTKEMGDFIETTLDYAEQVGIDTSDYKDLGAV